ncbi:MAG TPA: glycosyltransferase [Stellaceae bacterium]|nr:glycosyltransferase [Stellaceae bacterium]
MLNFRAMISAAALAAGDKPILAALYPLSPVLCSGLATEGIISGYVAEGNPPPREPNSTAAGWWMDRSAGSWFLRQASSPTMLLLGASPDYQIVGGLLLEARIKGVRRILYVAPDGSITREVDVAAALLQLLRLIDVEKPLSTPSHKLLYNDIYERLTERLRLPPAAFIPGRVLILIGNLAGGGAERQAAYTAAGLVKRFPGGVFVGRCFGGGSADFFKGFVDASGAKTCLLPSSVADYESPDLLELRDYIDERYSCLGGLDILYMIFHHALLVRELRPEIVHTWLDYSNALGGIAADLVGVPRLVMSGRSLAPDNFTIFQPHMAPAYHAILARRDAVILNNSEAGARDYARWLGIPAEKVRVVSNGFETPQLAPGSRAAVRSSLAIPQEAFVIGSLIGFREEKRPLLWMEMAVRLLREYPRLHFVVFGDGPLLSACRELVATNGLSDEIKLPGVTIDAWAALSAMDVFVLTSRVEGLPNVMIEAQLVGVPVVCTGTGGMYETFMEGETGFGVPEATPEALADAVSRLVNDAELRRRMGERGQARARILYSIDRMIEETIAAYKSAKEYGRDFPPDWQEPSSEAVARLGGIVREGNDRFAADLPPGPDVSELSVWEDEFPLQPLTGEVHAVAMPQGCYYIGEGRIWFSSSDGSDPRFNGRTYRVRPQHPGFDEVAIAADAIRAEIGHCFIVQLGLGDGSAHFKLWEDQVCLGPAACLHEEIRVDGGGRYSVWGECVYFSTSDNSDPRSNGRRYFLRREKLSEEKDLRPIRAAEISIDDAFRQLLLSAAPRTDFVPGRIVHIGGSLGPGGAERQIVYTTTALVNRPIESVQLLCYYTRPTSSDRFDFYLPMLRAAGVPVRNIRRHVGHRHPNTLPLSLRLLRDVLPPDLVADVADLYWEFLELRPQVVHAWLDGNLDRAGFAAALAGVPRIILAARNLNPTHFPYHRPYMLPAYQALIALPQVTMLNNSIAGRDDFAEWLGIDPAVIPVVYNGVDFGDYRRPDPGSRVRLRRPYGLDPAAFVIGGVFRFSAEKNPLLWIETAAAVARQLPDAQFILFGAGEMQAEMEALGLRLGLEGRLIFGGITDTVLEAIGVMDVFLLTSSFEGVPNVVLEAEWVGTPVVATRAGGTAEAIEDGVTGWIVDEPSVTELSNRLLWLRANTAAFLWAQHRGPVFVREKFGVNRMVNETVDLYGVAMSPSRADRNCVQFSV